ncbi:MAG: ABC transporter permease [Deltaproteobacteria bacterium]|nr:ABC transporter permease [Deltaproteobacteria bacterium]
MVVRLAGAWCLGGGLPAVEPVAEQLRGTRPRALRFDASGLATWDTGLLAFLDRLEAASAEREIPVERDALPEGVVRLLDLAHAVPSRTGLEGTKVRVGLLARAGERTLALLAGGRAVVTFVGQLAMAMGRLVTGRARFRSVDLAVFLQDTGAAALPIVTLISFLVGVILAFVGAVQLNQFGAEIYVADLVGLAMVRQMGALMAAIIMAGRTGAAFAAQLGAMKVNEEIDALTTMGIPPLDFLVLPRFLALCLMMPLLCIYADVLGIVGGFVVGTSMLDISFSQYWNQTVNAIGLLDCLPGLIMSVFFGALVATFGCLRGMQCAGSSSAVGDAATSAVVSGIVSIIVADAIFTVLFDVLGI